MKLWSNAKNSKRETITANGAKKRFTYGTSQLFNFTKDSYLERTSRPIYAVVFLLPFIVFYEFGTFHINTNVLNQQIRVVAFVWMQNMLESLGFGGKFAWAAPPLAVIVILLSLQFTCGKEWYFWIGDILPMILECILLAVPLIVLILFLNSVGSQREISRFDGSEISSQDNGLIVCASVQNYPLQSSSVVIESPEHSRHSLLANIVTGIGAGIYEELVFRLILICFLMLLFQDVLKLSHENAIILSVLISAALFSAHHHIDFFSGQPNIDDPFDWTKFTFRTIAGIYFAVLYAIRGFGITSGTHAFYNIIAVSIKAFF